ncbi:MAG TPA: hypothetical protein VGR21_13500, partial [Cryptosporangiaceae bacterium]|nr:hypothetical protein [Cryptosporangiaceae bacterium]
APPALPPVRIASGVATVRPPWPAAGVDPRPVSPWHGPSPAAYPHAPGSAPPGAGGYGGPPAGPPAMYRRRRGRGWTTFGLAVAGFCWLLWGGTVLVQPEPDSRELFTAAALVLGAAVGVYWLTRLAGHLVRTTLDRGPRKGTFVPHLATTLFLLLAASGFFTRAKDNLDSVGTWFGNLLPF